MLVIARAEVLPLLLAACPSFQPAYDGLLYPELGSLAAHVADLARADDAAALADALAAVERLHVEGDAEVREAATIGLLEALQNHVDVAARVVRGLGPESLRWWRGLDAFWSGRAPGVLPVDEP